MTIGASDIIFKLPVGSDVKMEKYSRVPRLSSDPYWSYFYQCFLVNVLILWILSFG